MPRSYTARSPPPTPRQRWARSPDQPQTLPVHELLVQSVGALHACPAAHVGQTPPPQSTSVSAPSLAWSAHWLATHLSEIPSQALLVQSALAAQSLPAAQVGQTPPPQSRSVS